MLVTTAMATKTTKPNYEDDKDDEHDDADEDDNGDEYDNGD